MQGRWGYRRVVKALGPDILLKNGEHLVSTEVCESRLPPSTTFVHFAMVISPRAHTCVRYRGIATARPISTISW